jgi:hypothetical protein
VQAKILADLPRPYDFHSHDTLLFHSFGRILLEHHLGRLGVDPESRMPVFSAFEPAGTYGGTSGLPKGLMSEETTPHAAWAEKEDG